MRIFEKLFGVKKREKPAPFGVLVSLCKNSRILPKNNPPGGLQWGEKNDIIPVRM